MSKEKKTIIKVKLNQDIIYVWENDKIIGCVDLTMKRLKGEFSTYSRSSKEEEKGIKAWEKLHQAWGEIADSYKEFKVPYKNKLLSDFNIDSGTDYANFVFNNLGLKH